MTAEGSTGRPEVSITILPIPVSTVTSPPYGSVSRPRYPSGPGFHRVVHSARYGSKIR